MSVSPFTGSTFVDATSVMAVPDGATSGILEHETPAASAPASPAARIPRRRETMLMWRCSTIRIARDRTFMDSAGQAAAAEAHAARRTRLDDGGFIMVVLLIGMAVSAVWLASALPSWRQQAIREKEAELIFRGEQYARAIHLYQCKNGTYPPNVDLLVSQRYLREKYKDPIANDDFVPVGGLVSTGQGQTSQVGITAVRSKSTDTSIKLYNGQQTYSQFAFETAVNGRMGACGGPAGGAQFGGRGGTVNGPGRGQGPRQGLPGGRGSGDETAPITPRRGGPGGNGGTEQIPRGAGPGGTPGNGSFGNGLPGAGGR